MINALKHIRKQFEQAWRHGAGDPDDEEDHGEYSHVKDADAKAIVDALKDHLGGTVQEVDAKAVAFALAGTQNLFATNQRKGPPMGQNWGQRNEQAARPLPGSLQAPTAGMEARLVRSAVHVGLLVGGGAERSTSTSTFKLVRTTHRFLAASFSWAAFFFFTDPD